MHNYHDTYGTLPLGMISTTRNGGFGTAGRWSWGAYLLPFVEQQALYDEIQIAGSHWWTYGDAVNNGQVRRMMQVSLAAYDCPSDNGPANNSNRRKNNHAVALSNYVAVNSSDQLRHWEGNVNPPQGQSQGADGLFLRNPWAKRFADILDGTSVQFMVGERCWELFDVTGTRRFCNAACVFGQDNHNGDNDRGMADAHGCMQYAINHRGNNNRCRRAFTSQHPGGAQFVLADGAVKFISEDVDWNNNNAVNSLAEKLCAISDGQSVEQF
jgi:hypothetical protein